MVLQALWKGLSDHSTANTSAKEHHFTMSI